MYEQYSCVVTRMNKIVDVYLDRGVNSVMINYYFRSFLEQDDSGERFLSILATTRALRAHYTIFSDNQL